MSFGYFLGKLKLILKEKKHKKRIKQIASVLSVFIVFITMYFLILPAITLNLEDQTAVLQTSQENAPIILGEEALDHKKVSSSVVEKETVATAELQVGQTKSSSPVDSEESSYQKAGRFEEELDDVLVTVDYPEKTFSQSVKLSVTRLVDFEAFRPKIDQVLSKDNRGMSALYAYDITFVNASGEEVKPLQKVAVSLKFKDFPKSQELQEEWKLFHVSNELNQVEEITQKETTVISELPSGEVAELSFQSDSFSPYVLAGVTYQDLKDFLTEASIEGASTYVEATKLLETHLKLGFNIPSASIKNSATYAMELPVDSSWGSALQPNVDYTGREQGKDAFKFRFVELNGKKYLAITFLESYLKTVDPESPIKGTVYYQANIGETNKTSDGSYTIPIIDKVTVTIPSQDITTVKTPDEAKYDIRSEKAGAIRYEGDEAYLDYKITISSDKGTKGEVKLSDRLTATGLTVSPLEIVSIIKHDYKYWYGDEGVNHQTLTQTYQPNQSGTAFDLTLPPLNARQVYTVTYRYKVSDIPAGKLSQVNNTLNVESPDIPKPSPKDVNLSVTRNTLAKSGRYDEASNKITWTITVNDLNNDIAGAVLTDDMFSKIKVAELTSDQSQGFSIEKNPNGTVKQIKFTATNGGKNTNKYIFTYVTPADETSNEWGTTAGSVINNATVTDKGESVKATATVGTGKGNTGNLEKTFAEINATGQSETKRLKWNIKISMPGSQKIPKGTQFHDSLTAGNSANFEHHYFTKAQLEDIYNQLRVIFGDITFVAQDSSWQNKPLDQFTDDQKYISFTYTLNQEFRSNQSDISLEYESTANVSSISTFKNKIRSLDISSEASYKYEATGRVSKRDGNNIVWDGIGNDYNPKDSENTIQKDGLVKWAIKVKLDDTTTKVSLVDTPPTGLTLAELTYGKLYGLNDSNQTVISGGNITKSSSWQTYSGIDLNGTVDANGAVSLTFSSNNGQTLKEQIGSEDFYVLLSFKTDVVPIDEDVIKTYKNTVSVSVNDQPAGEDDHTQKITIKPGVKLTKAGMWLNDNREVAYRLTLNPDALDLAVGKDSYVLTDILSYQEDEATKLSYDLKKDSVQLLDKTGQVVDPSLWSWTVEKVRGENGQIDSILKVNVPDSQTFTLQYNYLVTREVSASNKAQLSVKNSAEIERLRSGKVDVTTHINWSIVQAGGTSESIKFFKLIKVDAKNFGIGLLGATFEVRENSTDKVVARYQTKADGTISINSSSTDGIAGSRPLEQEKLYYVVETKAPIAYQLPDEGEVPRYYFYFSETDRQPTNLGDLVSNPPEMVNLAKQSKQIYVPNEKLPEKTVITVVKKWQDTDSKPTDRVDATITIDLIQIAVSADGQRSEKILKTVTIGKGDQWTKTFEELPLRGVNDSGQALSYAYRVNEHTLSGYDISYSVGEEGVTSGEVIVTNKAQKAYELPKTGGDGTTLFYVTSATLILVPTIGYIRLLYKRYRIGGD
ncbi:Cna B-type domain-containing protein [Streptococcus ovuberis]|uniref:Peptidase n=1 Tax=Streptococcus ovuberis TaxID=1936207 RepID=A0A7X6S2G0_9STRE|nr:Cna B-type domain-containing protein [Streptococcus ovuberis]NKZ21335.1 peptidase [Streptococcus ovuberis]